MGGVSTAIRLGKRREAGSPAIVFELWRLLVAEHKRRAQARLALECILAATTLGSKVDLNLCNQALAA